nr:hypothetical protein [Tanacetum cinerariifolium]
MDIFAFIHTLDLTKVKVVEWERKDDEPRLLETTIGRTVPLLLVAPDRGESELDASVDKLFDKSGSGTQTEQGDSADSEGTKVKVVEWERKDDEPRLLETTIGRTVPLLLVAPDRGESELDASVDKLFDKSGSGTQTEQGDSADSEGGQ